MRENDTELLLLDALQAVVEIHAEASIKVGAVIEELKCSVIKAREASND